MANKQSKMLRVTQVKSSSGRLRNHQASLKGLGIRRMNHTVTVAATPENLGMINKVHYMVKVEEV